MAHELDDDVLDDLAERGLHAVASQRRVDVRGELRDHLRVRLALEREAALLLRSTRTRTQSLRHARQFAQSNSEVWRGDRRQARLSL